MELTFTERQAIERDAGACREVANNVARLLAQHASRQQTVQRGLRAVNFVVGAMVAVLSLRALGAGAPDWLGERFLTTSALVAAALLVLDASLPGLRGEPNPERFRDYSFYVQQYASELKQHLADTTVPPEVWRARIGELCRVTRLNVDDVFRKWPWMRNRLERQGKLNRYWG